MKQNKNLLSSRLTENRMNDQNIQSKPDSAIQEKSNPVLEKKLNKINNSLENLSLTIYNLS